MTSNNTTSDLSIIDRQISTANKYVKILMLAVFASYPIWFFVINNKSISDSVEAWGQFGDFIGGLLNPLVAYAAFFWLTRSIILQKEELVATRKSLKEATEAQAEQARLAHISARLSALDTLTNAISQEVQMQRQQLQFIVEQRDKRPNNGGGAYLLDGEFKVGAEINKIISEINNRISMRMTERMKYEIEILEILNGRKESAAP